MIYLSTKYLIQENTHISINVFKWQHSIRIFVCRRLSLLLMASMASNIRNNMIRVSITLEFDVKCKNFQVHDIIALAKRTKTDDPLDLKKDLNMDHINSIDDFYVLNYCYEKTDFIIKYNETSHFDKLRPTELSH